LTGNFATLAGRRYKVDDMDKSGVVAMKWMIVMIVLGTQPVKTNLLFEDLKTCSGVVDVIRQQQAEAYNAAIAWKKQQSPSAVDLGRFQADRMRVFEMENTPTCIPHSIP
jgi:hypothetical protein